MAVKRRGPTPTQRTLAECRKRGWLAGVVERRLPHTFTTVDLFGFIDVVAITRGRIIGIQATSGPHVADRVTKITTERNEQARAWLVAGGEIVVWGWSKRGGVGERKLWTVREVEITMVDLESAEVIAA